jgi:2,5-diketo-D-gluconate reductase A
VVSIPSLSLNDGNSIPQLGLGTWPLRGEDAAVAISTAIELGYRHIDSARRYENEEGVGEGIRRSGIDRSEVFVTTKLDGQFQGEDRAIAGLHGSLELFGLEYVDLLLIHWPLPARGEFVSTWKSFEKLQRDGLVRSIGVSNFKPAHLDVLREETDVVPAVNQIQLSPIITRREQRAYHEAHGIVTESWTPIKGVLGDPVIAGIAEKHGKTPAQVALRWHIENGLVVIPKSSDPARMTENMEIFDFTLDADDLAAIDTLDGGPDAGVDSDHEGH